MSGASSPEQMWAPSQASGSSHESSASSLPERLLCPQTLPTLLRVDSARQNTLVEECHFLFSDYNAGEVALVAMYAVDRLVAQVEIERGSRPPGSQCSEVLELMQGLAYQFAREMHSAVGTQFESEWMQEETRSSNDLDDAQEPVLRLPQSVLRARAAARVANSNSSQEPVSPPCVWQASSQRPDQRVDGQTQRLGSPCRRRPLSPPQLPSIPEHAGNLDGPQAGDDIFVIASHRSRSYSDQPGESCSEIGPRKVRL
mmetsp:Transcript_59795/g.142350  ORF Transcript_59795/g.142350 Transcript_59795/m.142350 type:complete len:257 (-) Transcript_59795:142-912(-)